MNILCVIQVRQMHLVTPLDNHFSVLYSILTEHIAEDVDYKVCSNHVVDANVTGVINLI